MKIFLSILGILLLFYLFNKFFFPGIGKRLSKNEWERFINNPEMAATFEKGFGIRNANFIIRNILIPLDIDYMKYMSNLIYLLCEGDSYYLTTSSEAKFFSKRTQSIVDFASRLDRPMTPLWALAAIPDIYQWINDDNNDNDTVENRIKILFDGVNIPESQSLEEQDPSNFSYIREIAKKYILITNRKLETQQ